MRDKMMIKSWMSMMLMYCIIVAAPTNVVAQSAAASWVQGDPTLSIKPSTGFVHTVMWAGGNSLGYFVTDGATYIEARITDLVSKSERTVALPPTLLHPVAAQVSGTWLVIIAKNDQGQKFVHWVDPAGSSLNAAGKPAARRKAPKASAGFDDIAFVTRNGKKVLATIGRSAKSTGTRATVSLLDPSTGKKLGRSGFIDFDQRERATTLNFQILYWSEGFTRAHGLRDGEFVRANDRRGATTDAVFDVVAGKFTVDRPLSDLTALRTQAETLRIENQLSFVRFSSDRTKIEVWQNGKPHAIDLPLAVYKTDSISSAIEPNGVAWIGIAVEPANAVARAAKKVDAAMFDVYRVDPLSATPLLVRRIPAENKSFTLGLAGDLLWIAENNRGFSSGAKQVDAWRVLQ